MKEFAATDLLSAIEDGIVAIDLAGNLAFQNEAASAMLGWTEQEALGNSWQTILKPGSNKDSSASETEIGQTLRDGIKRRVDAEAFLRKDGTELPVEYSCSPIHDTLGKLVGVVVSFREVSSPSALPVSDLHLRQLVDSVPITIWMATPDGKIDYVNRRFLRFAGFTPEETLKKWEASIHPEDRDRFLRAWIRSVETEQRFEQECRVRRKDGVYRWFRMEGVPVRDSNGRLQKWYGSAINIHTTRALEAQARQLAERLTVTLESITDGVLLLDRNWRTVFMNTEAEKLLERSRKDLIGKNIWEEFPAAVDLLFHREYHRAVRESTTVAFEEYEPNLHKWFYVKAFPSSEGLAVYFQDVSERRQALEALKASEERFRLLSNATNDVIWDWEKSTGELWLSDGFKRLFGYTRKGSPLDPEMWAANIHPDERTAITSSLTYALESGQAEWSGEYRFLRSDNTYAWVSSRATIIRDETGQIVRMLGGMTDITERRFQEEKVREQAALLDETRDAIIVRDLDHKIRYWNKGAERLYGWTATEAVGQSIRGLLYKTDHPFLDATREVLTDGEWSGELEQQTKEGQTVLVEGRWTLVRDATGRPTAIMAINTDISDRKELEAQVLRTQRIESIGTLAGGVAHDLNNVLSPIVIGTDLLRRDETDERRLRLLSTIHASAQRGADLVRQVLAFSRGLEGQRKVIDLCDVVDAVEQIVRDTFPKNIEIVIDCPRDLWPMSGNFTHLHQVLMNLLVNARDAMSDGGRLSVTAKNLLIDETHINSTPDSRCGPYISIRVADTGSGISRETREKIFDPFFTTKEIGKGTGLGLSTVLSIVKNHGGFIRVSTDRNNGAVFDVYLPALADEEAVKQMALEQPHLQSGRGELILVIDDEKPILEIAAETLERFSYRTLTAENGAEAVALYAERRDEIAAVFTDLAMPVMDGHSTIAALRAINPQVRILATSGLESSESVMKAISAGAADFLPKPYAIESLLKKLHTILEHPS